MSLRALLPAASATLAAPSAFAHPGNHHDGLLATFVHLLTEPDHLALVALTGVVGWAAVRAIQRRDRTPR